MNKVPSLQTENCLILWCMIILGVSSSPSAANHAELKVRKISGQKIVIALLFKLLLPKVRATLDSNSQQKNLLERWKAKKSDRLFVVWFCLGFFDLAVRNGQCISIILSWLINGYLPLLYSVAICEYKNKRLFKVGELTTLTAVTLHFSFIFTSFNASIHFPRMYPFHHSYYSEKHYSRVTCSLYCIHGLSEERIFEKYPGKTWWKTAKGSKFSINLKRLI